MNTFPDNAPGAVIVGLGRTGISCARYLHARGWRLAVTDTRAAPPELAALRALDAAIPVSLGALDTRLLAGAVCVVASPGVSLAAPFFTEARRLGLEIVGDVELFARAAHAPVVGITGTNGKSTVTTLLGRMAGRAGLKVQVGGNLGAPALELLDAATELYVLELSSYQLETTESLHCRAAAVLNVSPDHLDRYADVAAYTAAKARLFARCDIAVINLDDPLVVAMPHAAARTLSFSLRAAIGADYAIARSEGAWWLTRRDEPLLPLAAMKIKGLHNAANALAALALGEALGLPQAAMLEELRNFAGLAHRSQWVADLDGVTYVDDSKGTNVGAVIEALAAARGPVILIAGGVDKGGDYGPLRAPLKEKVKVLILIGAAREKMRASLEGATAIEIVTTLTDAVRISAAHARHGDTVMLSPACSSFDQFKDYAERGRVFQELVRAL
jgi:UDP-N-acetylmuramoylalanine--D-glutamate ligase